MKGNRKAGFFPLFIEAAKSSRGCGPDCDCHKTGKKTDKDTKKK